MVILEPRGLKDQLDRLALLDKRAPWILRGHRGSLGPVATRDKQASLAKLDQVEDKVEQEGLDRPDLQVLLVSRVELGRLEVLDHEDHLECLDAMVLLDSADQTDKGVNQVC